MIYTAHTATINFGTQDRLSHRFLSISEKPYLDVNSKGIKEALAEEKAAVWFESTESENYHPVLWSQVQEGPEASGMLKFSPSR